MDRTFDGPEKSGPRRPGAIYVTDGAARKLETSPPNRNQNQTQAPPRQQEQRGAAQRQEHSAPSSHQQENRGGHDSQRH